MTALHDGVTVDVGAITDLTAGEGRTYAVDGRQIAVYLLSDGTLRATDAMCPHKAGPLADGQIDDAVVVCPLHQYSFSFDTGGGERFWIEFAGPDGFDAGRLGRVRARGPFPGSTGTVDVTSGRWRRIVDRARRESGGFPAVVTWRVRCRDALLRETVSDPRTITVNP